MARGQQDESPLGAMVLLAVGKNYLKHAILTRNRETILDILRWKSCGTLLAQEHSLLKLLVTTGQRKLLHEAFELFGKDSDACLIKSVQSALKHDDNETLDAMLSIVKELNDDRVTGTLFERCVFAKNYRCSSIIFDWHIPLMYESKNILHFAAEMDNVVLLKYAPMNEIFLDKTDETGQYPMGYVQSRPMAEKLNERWQVETSKRPPKSWDCVQAMHAMSAMYGLPDHTLKFRSSFMTHQLQRLAETSSASAFVLKVSRISVFKDSYAAVYNNTFSKYNWYKNNLKLEVVFDGEMGSDAGGLRLEWLSLMVEAMIKPNPEGKVADFTAPLFAEIDPESGMYAPIMNYDENVYEFAGSIIALAFRENITLKVNLIPSVIKSLLPLSISKSNLENLNQQNPSQFKAFQKLKELSEEDIESAELAFESNPQVRVTKQNLDDYIEDYALYHTYTKFIPILKALSSGFSKICNFRHLHTIFTQQEMTDILRGAPCIGLDSLKKHSNVAGTERSKEIFWEMMGTLSEDEKLNFFKFITGRHSVPFEGITGLQDKLEIRLDTQKAGFLPTASTCFSTIYFAEDINTPEEMKLRLLKSMENAVGFSLI